MAKPTTQAQFWLALLLWGCGPASPNQPLVVAAAASLQGPFLEIGRGWPSQSIRFHFAASGQLQKQIEQGAPIDVLASASAKSMLQLEKAGMVRSQHRRIFARNSLVLIGSQETPRANLESLAQQKFRFLAIGDPVTVPAGHYAMQALGPLSPDLKLRLLPCQDARQVVDYVRRGEAEFGIAYHSDIQKAPVFCLQSIPSNRHDPILYPIASLAESAQPQAAQAFIDRVCSPEGQKILERHGLLKAEL